MSFSDVVAGITSIKETHKLGATPQTSQALRGPVTRMERIASIDTSARYRTPLDSFFKYRHLLRTGDFLRTSSGASGYHFHELAPPPESLVSFFQMDHNRRKG